MQASAGQSLERVNYGTGAVSEEGRWQLGQRQRSKRGDDGEVGEKAKKREGKMIAMAGVECTQDGGKE